MREDSLFPSLCLKFRKSVSGTNSKKRLQNIWMNRLASSNRHWSNKGEKEKKGKS